MVQRSATQPAKTGWFVRMVGKLPVFRVALFEFVSSTVVHMLVPMPPWMRVALVAVPGLILAFVIWRMQSIQLEVLTVTDEAGFLHNVQDTLQGMVIFATIYQHYRPPWFAVSSC